MTSTFDLTHDLDFEFSMSNFEIVVFQELLVWLMCNKNEKKEADPFDTGLGMWPCSLNMPMALTLNFQGQSLR